MRPVAAMTAWHRRVMCWMSSPERCFPMQFSIGWTFPVICETLGALNVTLYFTSHHQMVAGILIREQRWPRLHEDVLLQIPWRAVSAFYNVEVNFEIHATLDSMRETCLCGTEDRMHHHPTSDVLRNLQLVPCMASSTKGGAPHKFERPEQGTLNSSLQMNFVTGTRSSCCEYESILDFWRKITVGDVLTQTTTSTLYGCIWTFGLWDLAANFCCSESPMAVSCEPYSVSVGRWEVIHTALGWLFWLRLYRCPIYSKRETSNGRWIAHRRHSFMFRIRTGC